MAKINIATEIVSLLVTMILLFCSFVDKNHKMTSYRIFIAMLVVNMLLLIEDVLAWSFENTLGHDIFLYINASIGYSLGYIVSCLLSHYIVASIDSQEENLKRFTYGMDVICAAAIGLVVLSGFNNMFFSYRNGEYARGNFYWLSQAIPIFMLMANEFIVLKNNKRLGIRYTLSLLSYGVLPVVAMMVQYSFLDLEITYVASTLSLLIIHVMINTEQSRMLQEKKTELEKTKVSLMLSQIQPHFLYNTLGTIGYLCEKNPPLAKDTVTTFARYLRYNIDSVTRKSLIPFAQELEHIEKYVSLEKIRFDEKIKMEYEIYEKNFMIPILSVQPLVENAVKHGIGDKKEGGTVYLKTFSRENSYQIIVQDDGIGFDENVFKTEGHNGINNVRTRIKLQCGGDVAVESAVGKGTTATITIPK